MQGAEAIVHAHGVREKLTHPENRWCCKLSMSAGDLSPSEKLGGHGGWDGHVRAAKAFTKQICKKSGRGMS
jgi:hypothetical protein